MQTATCVVPAASWLWWRCCCGDLVSSAGLILTDPVEGLIGRLGPLIPCGPTFYQGGGKWIREIFLVGRDLLGNPVRGVKRQVVIEDRKLGGSRASIWYEMLVARMRVGLCVCKGGDW